MTARTSWARFAAIAAALLLASIAVDRWAFTHVVHARVYEEDWGRLLRVMGFWPLWCLASIAIALEDAPLKLTRGARAARSRAVLLITGVSASGIAGELLKLLLRRERPGAHEGAYYFRPFTERTFSSSGLALPSSHAIVAFGAAMMLSRLFPRARPVWYALAIGCGLTRVLARAHFVSDITTSALAAWAITAWLWGRYERRTARNPQE